MSFIEWVIDQIKGGPGAAGAAQAPGAPGAGSGQPGAPLPPTFGRQDPSTAIDTGPAEWRRDPYQKTYPTKDDVSEERDYKRQYGDPNVTTFEPGQLMASEPVHDWEKRTEKNNALGWNQPKEKITPKQADYLTTGSMISAGTPMTAHQTNPSKTTVYNDPTMSGYYGMTNTPTQNVWLDTGNSPPQTVPHEEGHVAFEQLYDHPEGKKIIHDIYNKFLTGTDRRGGLSISELITRANMQRHFGRTAESKTELPPGETDWSALASDNPALYQTVRTRQLLLDPKFQNYMRALDKVAAHQDAQRVIEKTGGVYRRGGRVQRLKPKAQQAVRTARVRSSRPR